MTFFARIGASRWFYIGLPVLALIAGLLVGLSIYISVGVGAHYHNVVPTGHALLVAKLLVGAAAAGSIALLLMVSAKFLVKSPRRGSLVALCCVGWSIGAAYLVATSPPDAASYVRTFEGQRYSIPWQRLPGELTLTGNPTTSGAVVDQIGFTYCGNPFDSAADHSSRCRQGTFLAGAPGVSAHPLTSDPVDPDGTALLAHLLNPDRDQFGGSSSSSSGGSSSTSSGAVVSPWSYITAERSADISGMMAFTATSFGSSPLIYLFEPAGENADRVHRAVCNQGVANAQVVDEALTCQHYIREGDRAWTFTLPVEDAARASERLIELRRQLETFRAVAR